MPHLRYRHRHHALPLWHTRVVQSQTPRRHGQPRSVVWEASWVRWVPLVSSAYRAIFSWGLTHLGSGDLRSAITEQLMCNSPVLGGTCDALSSVHDVRFDAQRLRLSNQCVLDGSATGCLMRRHQFCKPTFGPEHRTFVSIPKRSHPHARHVIRVQSQLDQKRLVSGFNGLDRTVQVFVGFHQNALSTQSGSHLSE